MENKKQKSFDFEGTTVEAAISKALKELDVTRDQLSVKVVSEEKKGLFGMEGAKPARIIVIIKDEESEQ